MGEFLSLLQVFMQWEISHWPQNAVLISLTTLEVCSTVSIMQSLETSCLGSKLQLKPASELGKMVTKLSQATFSGKSKSGLAQLFSAQLSQLSHWELSHSNTT